MEIYLAGGCFWGIQKYMDCIPGVLETQVGYANGTKANPTYEQVCSGNSQHAETVRVVYDPAAVSLPFLLDLFYRVIDPCSVNRQGGDAGDQYRTGVYYSAQQDEPVIRSSLAGLQKRQAGTVVVEALPLSTFWPAEEYHQKYLDKNPSGYCHISEHAMQCAARSIVDEGNYPAPDQEMLRKQLTKESYEVTQNAVTERPFHNAYWDAKEPGIYVDITTGEPLFLSADKFDSGCGWPSFSKPIDPGVVRETNDTSHGMLRTEVRSRSGNAHLGHVFDDGPPEKGSLRYCINSASLRFIPINELEQQGYGYLAAYVQE